VNPTTSVLPAKDFVMASLLPKSEGWLPTYILLVSLAARTVIVMLTRASLGCSHLDRKCHPMLPHTLLHTTPIPRPKVLRSVSLGEGGEDGQHGHGRAIVSGSITRHSAVLTDLWNLDLCRRTGQTLRGLSHQRTCVVSDADVGKSRWVGAFQLGSFRVQDDAALGAMARADHRCLDWPGVEFCPVRVLCTMRVRFRPREPWDALSLASWRHVDRFLPLLTPLSV